MNPGDLVVFETSVKVWMRDYHTKNPGIIMKISGANFRIFWSDGSKTNEHGSYLRKAGGGYK